MGQITYLERPVMFMGADTGMLAQSARHASIKVFWWLIKDPRAPRVDRRYCEKFHTTPSMGRLYKNTRLEDNRWIVGLGLPDRRRTYAGT